MDARRRRGVPSRRLPSGGPASKTGFSSKSRRKPNSSHGDVLSALAGAVRSRLPDSVAPELTTLVNEVPDGDDWLHEIKFDGYRALCRIEDGSARFYTREGNDWTDRFGALASAAAALPLRLAFLDGEIVVLDDDGSSNFQSLQEALSRGDTGRLCYYVFDLLYLDGYDVREVPLSTRKEILSSLLLNHQQNNGPIRFSDHVIGRARDFYSHACETGLEGIISKRKDSHYRPGRARDWLKIKCHASQEFVIGGFTEP